MHKRKLQDIIEEIKTCGRLYPEFAGAESLVSSLYRAKDSFDKKPSQPGPINLTAEEIREKLTAGSPLIDNPGVGKEAFLDLYRALTPQFVKQERGLKAALKELEAFFTGYFAESEGDSWPVKDMPDMVSRAVEHTPVREDLITLIVTFILSSLFELYYNLEEADNIDAAVWNQGNCPVCGVKPHYGLLKDKEGVRMLACWLCGFRWVFPRLMCPYCLNKDLDHLGFFTVESRESCRVNFCKKCSSYVKVFDLKEAVAEDVHLPVRNLATLLWDFYGKKEGFEPGSGLHWVNQEEQKQSAN